MLDLRIDLVLRWSAVEPMNERLAAAFDPHGELQILDREAPVELPNLGTQDGAQLVTDEVRPVAAGVA